MRSTYVQDLRKIVLIFSINAQYMHTDLHKIVLISECTIYAQEYTYFPNAQHLRKIVLLSAMCNICTTRLQASLEEICHISRIYSKFRMVFTLGGGGGGGGEG